MCFRKMVEKRENLISAASSIEIAHFFQPQIEFCTSKKIAYKDLDTLMLDPFPLCLIFFSKRHKTLISFE